MSTLLLQDLLSWKVKITKEQLSVYFGSRKEAFMKDYMSNNEGIWTISMDDLPKIAMMFGEEPFGHLRLKFVENIRTKQLNLKNFLEVTYLGMKLFDVTDNNPDEKQSGRLGCEKEEHFAIPLKKFYSSIYHIKKNEISPIRDKAFLEGPKHSNYIMYDIDDHDNCIFIEFAANLEVGDAKTDNTIVGHIARLLHNYSKYGVMFERSPGERKETSKVPIEKMWFLYFDREEKILAQIEEIVQETKDYHPLNMIFCHYDFKKYDKMEFRVKLHQEKIFSRIVTQGETVPLGNLTIQ